MVDYKDFAISSAKKAGKIMLENFSFGIKKEWKEDNTPLTIADTAINNLIVTEVQKYFSTHGIIGEEESHVKENAEYVWLCDPIDGTIPFSHSVPVATFSLALTHKGKVILGVIYDPFMDRLFFAEKGKGTYLNDTKIFVSKAATLHQTVVSIESFNSPQWNYANLLKIFMQEKVKMTSLCSYTYGGGLVAAGEFGAALFGWKTPWDVAAVKILVEEAGGKCTDLFGNDQLYDRETKGFVASNGLLHDELIRIIRSTTADPR